MRPDTVFRVWFGRSFCQTQAKNVLAYQPCLEIDCYTDASRSVCRLLRRVPRCEINVVYNGEEDSTWTSARIAILFTQLGCASMNGVASDVKLSNNSIYPKGGSAGVPTTGVRVD